MEYALSYALYNWRRVDTEGGLTYENMKLIRSFSGLESEKGFILTHVTMVANTPTLVRSVFKVLEGAKAQDRVLFNKALDSVCAVMKRVNAEMETMWSRSKAKDYQRFRTFIMGIKNQPMFPKGVVYEGVSSQPAEFRGESGANDSIIPTMDNLLELYDKMPQNPLTEILKDFRQYRPIGHQIWLDHVYTRSKQLHVRKYALADSVSALKYLANLDQIRDFRWRHWNFTKEYILKNTHHPVATGGSPIVTWLPNQLRAVLEAMTEVIHVIRPEMLGPKDKKALGEYAERASTQHRVLSKEVDMLKKQYPGQDL